MKRVKWKWRGSNTPFEVDLDAQEWAWFSTLRDRVVVLQPCEERTRILNEVCVFMELKDSFPGSGWVPEADPRFATSSPVEAAVDVAVPMSPEARTEALAALDAMEGRGYRMPAVAREAVVTGQTSLLAEGEPPAPSAPLRQPYKDEPDEEPQPLATEAHARTSDPWTAHAAARSLTPEKLRSTQQAVLDCFKSRGAMSHEDLCISYDLERAVRGWPRQSVSGLRTRTSELVAAGYVQDTGRTVRLESGKRSIVWEAKG